MGKRFSRLNFALKMIGKKDSAPDDINPDKNSLIYDYWQYRTGNVRVTGYTGTETKGIENVVVRSFESLGTAQYIVEISKRTNDFLGNTKLPAKAEWNHVDSPTDEVESAGFIPAKAIVGLTATGLADKDSKITGFKYKPTVSESYTIPFGEAATAVGYGARRTAIMDAANAKGGLVVSFKEERLMRG